MSAQDDAARAEAIQDVLADIDRITSLLAAEMLRVAELEREQEISHGQ